MSEKLKIVYRPLQELSPYAHNARTHSTEQVAQLVESIKQFGWTNPVLIDEKGEIIAGHGRVMAAEMLKMDSVPVIVLSGLTDEQKKAYRLADNRLPMNAGWDEDLLRMELSDLINADFDVSLTGFIPTEIDELLTDVLPGTGNEEEPYTTKIDTPVYEPSGGKPDMAYSRVSTFSGDYLRVTDNKGKTHDVLTGSDDGRHSNTSLAWGAGVQFNPTESVAIDIAYEGSGSGDWRTDGFIVGVGYKF
ncbi:Ail/Lom family outer membrane beta-barrel protein [Escherichia coli]